jgi:maleamate amidohydrolase
MDLERKNLGVGKTPALVLVDMIKGFTDGACPLGNDCPDVVAANARLLAEFRRRDLPIFFTTVV